MAMIALGWGRQRQSSRAWATATVRTVWKWRSQPAANVVSKLVWCILIVGVIGWDLLSFIVQSPSFPTLSGLVGHVTHHPVGRGLLFAVWLAVGWYVASGYRSRSQR